MTSRPYGRDQARDRAAIEIKQLGVNVDQCQARLQEELVAHVNKLDPILKLTSEKIETPRCSYSNWKEYSAYLFDLSKESLAYIH